MIYQDLYWNAAIIYSLGVIGFWLVVWKVGTKIPWRPLRWWLTWLYLCVVLTPWKGSEPEEYYAPAIIVAAFDFLDLGLAPALSVLRPMMNALIVGSTVIVGIAIVRQLMKMKKNAQSEESADSQPEM